MRNKLKKTLLNKDQSLPDSNYKTPNKTENGKISEKMSENRIEACIKSVSQREESRSKNHTIWWLVSFCSIIALISVLVSYWIEMNDYKNATRQLVDKQATNSFLRKLESDRVNRGEAYSEPLIKVKTGIFIQSLAFYNSSEVSITGYIWQRYEDGVNDFIKPDQTEIGFILPDQIDSSTGPVPREAYRLRNGKEEVIGWYFEAILKQSFDYFYYPFDHKTVWVRLLPRDFARNIVLVPDFDAYNSTGPKDIFGIEDEIVLGTWERKNTYFNYKLSNYDTNFGISTYIGLDSFPELNYNFVIKRKFKNAFIIHLLPLFLVAALLFGSLLTISADPKKAGKHGFSTSSVLGVCSALFFVVLMAHIQLREQFASTTIVYMEWFYFLMYGLLVAVFINTYLFSAKGARWLKIVHYGDNLVPKIAFWPVMLGGMVLITWFVR